MNLNGLRGAKLDAATDSLSISTGLKWFRYLEKDVTWVTPDNSQVCFTVLNNRQICSLSPFQNPWVRRYIFVLVASRRTVKSFAFAASIWTINLFAPVTSRWTAYFLWWWAGELCICTGDEPANCVFHLVASRETAYLLWWRVGELRIWICPSGESANWICICSGGD